MGGAGVRPSESCLGEAWDRSRISHRHADPARDVLFLAARRLGGVSLREIAIAEGLDYGSVANARYRIRRRVETAGGKPVEGPDQMLKSKRRDPGAA